MKFVAYAEAEYSTARAQNLKRGQIEVCCFLLYTGPEATKPSNKKAEIIKMDRKTNTKFNCML